MTTKFKNVNNYVLSFLQKNCDDDIVKLWSAKTVQSKFKSLLNKKERKTDPNAPKRAKSAYLYFCAKHRETVKKSLGKKASATNVTRELGVRWNKLKKRGNTKEMKSLQALANKDRERYLKAKAAYVPPEGVGKAKKGPKRAKSAYLYFCEKNRKKVIKELGSVPTTEITRKLGELWNELKKSGDVSEYAKMAAKDKKRYEQEKNKKEVKKEVKKRPVKKKTTTTTKTRKKTGYQIFCSVKRPELKKQNPKMDVKDITKEISRLWRSLTDEEKDSYKQVKSV